MKHFQTALAIFATSVNALHLDQEGTQSLEPLLLSNTEASANTSTQAAAHALAQVNDTETRVSELEDKVEDFEKMFAFFGDTCVSQSDHTCFCLSTGETHPIIVHEESGKTVSVKLFDKEFNTDEIGHLKTLNGQSDETTYEIF